MPGSLTLPMIVFAAEVCVVTLSTVRIIALGRGNKGLAALLGLFEVTIWLFAISQVMQNLSSLSCAAAFAVGFALGNYVGVVLDQKLALGSLVVQVITPRDPEDLLASLQAANYGVTCVDGRGKAGPVQLILTVIPRRELANVVALLKRFDPNVFYSVDSLQIAAAGVFPLARPRTGAQMRDWRTARCRP